MLDLTVRLIASLAVVVGLLLLLARLAGRRFSTSAGMPVQVLHRQPLSRTSGVAVVTVGTRVLVLGTTEHQVSLLTELMPDELDTEPVPDEDLAGADLPADETEASTLALPGQGVLAGSLLSPRTWQQAVAAVTRKAS